MSKVLFVNGNVHGHINPTLPLVKELIIRGEEVVYFSTEDFREKIEKTGASFLSYGEKLDHFLRNYRPVGNHPFYTLLEFMLKMDETVIPIVMDAVKGMKFDYMIHDSMFGGGKVLADLLSLQAVCSCTSFAMNRLPMPPHMFQPGFHPQLDALLKEMERVVQLWNVSSVTFMDIFFKKENLNLVYTSKLFQPEADSFDSSFCFVGPSIEDRYEPIDFALEECPERKLIYISMGTINNQCVDFYRNCMEAFRSEEVKVIMSVGKKTESASLGVIPENFIIRNYVPQLRVLRQADAFISHGGLNSVSEALYYGIPIVAIPQANDQPMVTRQLVTLGAGIGMKMEEITPQLLRDAANKVMREDTYKAASIRLGDSFRAAGGYRAAADQIMEYKKTGGVSG